MHPDERAWQVPRHDLCTFAPRRTRYAVVVTVLNEGVRLAHQLERMRASTDVCDIVVADGPTTDGSTEDTTMAAHGVHAVTRLREPGGFSSSLRTGLAYAMRAGYDGAILMNGNDKDDPDALPRFVERLGAGMDYVQGDRFLPGGLGINTPWHREALIRYVHSPLFSRISGMRCADTTNGFRAFSRRLLLDARVRPWRAIFAHYELEYYLAWAACRYGFRVTEIPVTRRYPAHTPTKIRGLPGHWRMLQPLVMLALGRY